ncbi:MAG: VOC family protein [Halobacteriota archaeon]
MELPSSTLPDTTSLGRTALSVADLAEMIEFYRDVVGLTVLTREETDAPAATLGVDGTPVLVLVVDEDAPARDSRGAGLYHNAFRVPGRGALGDALRRVRNGWQVDGASDHGFSEALYFSDPEGNGIEVYRDQPRENWALTPDGTLRVEPPRPLDLDALDADATGEPNAPEGTTLGHIHLEVSSIAESRAFYVDTLGFGVMMELPPTALFVAAGGYHHHVGMNTWNSRSTPVDGRGLAWFEIVVPDEVALAAVRARLEDADRRPTELDEGVQVADPDGIAIRLRTEA